nr:unnamed protein product [Spirometra erinaceieuropaei]
MPCYPTPYPSMECHGSCCQLNDQWGGPMPCPQSHCMLANRHQSSDQCCQNYLCECNQAASYREQEPPRLPTQYVSEATAHPKSPFTAEDDQSGKFCPACAGLAAAAATSDFGCNQLRRIGSQSNDLDAALVDVWASAATATTADQQQQQQQHHHPHSHHHHHHHQQQHNHTSGVNQRRRELAFSEQNRPRNRVGDCPSGGGGGNGAVGGGSGRRAPSSPTANLEELLVGCINQPSQSNAELRGLGGHSRGFSADRHRRSDSKSELFYCDASETEPCQQCDAEAAAAAMCDRETGGGGGSGCCPNNQGTKFGTNSGKPDIRVLRRVATVSRDIAEIVRGIRYFQKKNENKERLNKIVNEWRAVGSVLDRLFFICYLFAISISIILYFPRAADSL